MHITIGTPVLGQVDARFAVSMVKATYEAHAQGHKLTWSVIMQDAMLARARNSIVREFLASDSERLVFVDSDMVFQFSDVLALVESDRDVIGAVVSRKSDSGATNAAILKDGIIAGNHQEVAFLGTGFLSLSRKCLESMVKQYPETAYRNAPNEPESFALFDTGVMSGQFVGEDLMFCLRWRKMAGRVWAHTGLDVGHIGTRDYRVAR